MTRFLTIALILLTALALLSPANSGAGGKKGEKKKVAPSSELVVEGELVNADVKDTVRTGSHCKMYTFKMTEGKAYQIDMKSKVLDSYLRLENPDGKQVAADDDSGGGLNALITYTAPKTGDYQIIATTLAGGTGKFTLSVRDAVAAKPIAMKLDKGQGKYSGELSATDPPYAAKRHKLFHVELKAGQNYTIDMQSQVIDSYLYLMDPKGAIVAQDDDSGGDLNARITFKATVTGRYGIIATAFAGRSTGEFTLSVRPGD